MVNSRSLYFVEKVNNIPKFDCCFEVITFLYKHIQYGDFTLRQQFLPFFYVKS